MQKLIQGLHQFQQNIFRAQQKFFEELAKGQHPQTLFITCSDSRINPNLITQTKPGELFILRNAGNIIPPYGPSIGGEVATIEYAVSALNVRDIIVCGHSHCGAMDAIIHPEQVAKLPAVSSWLGHAEATRRIVEQNYKHLQGEALFNAAIQENVLVQLKHLQTQPAVAAALSAGQLSLYGWVYKIETGEVFEFDPVAYQFVRLFEGKPPTRTQSQQSRLRAI